jgi:hypothetical protein
MRKEWERKFSMGAIFVAVGVVFMTSVSQPLGVVFMAVGGLYMMAGARGKKG